MTDLKQFLSTLHVNGSSPWTLDDLRALARTLSLTKASIREICAAQDEQDTLAVVEAYNAAVMEEYGPAGDRWLPEDPKAKRHLFDTSLKGAGCFVRGPSGCAKTLMVKWLARELALTDHCAIFLAARDFPGSCNEHLRRELGQLIDRRHTDVLRAMSRFGRPIVIVLDGINELGFHRSHAIRGVRALARRYGAKLVVTGSGSETG